MNYDLIDPLYNVQKTEFEKVVTSLTVETALPLVLTQDPDEAQAKNYLFLPATATVKIIAYDLTISGTLRFPGQDVVIFTRFLDARANAQPPAIMVNGVPPPDNYEQLRPALKQRPPQLDEGDAGSPSYLETGFQSHDATWAGDGWSGPEHPAEMNGRDGKDGDDRAGVYENGKCTDKRGDAGSIFICCERMEFPLGTHLELSANGGPGEPGQPGQDGAKGGRGGSGLHGDPWARHVGGPVWPTSGGRGGNGGNGGKGGDGGKGGKGGSITVHCISAAPPVTCSVAGGDSQPGKGGAGGDRGEGGRGGRGSETGPEYCPRMETANDGPPGREKGEDGKDGASHPGDPGTASVNSGEVAKAALASLASLAQLQMVFEKARGDYLVTPVPDYQVQMRVVPNASALPTTGYRDTFLLAMVGSKLHVRVFGADGTPALDWTEVYPASGEAVRAAKQLFALIDPRIVLTGDRPPVWRSLHGALSAEERNALVRQLGGLTKQPADDFAKLADAELLGQAAVAAFLLAAGIRDRAWLKAKSADDHRNELIATSSKHTKRTVGELQGLTNQQLIGVTFEWFDWAKRVTVAPDAPKELFTVLPARVLFVGTWQAPGVSYALSADRRSTLRQQLGELTGIPRDYFERMGDDGLTFWGALTAFVLAAGLLEPAELKQLIGGALLEALHNWNLGHSGRSREELEELNADIQLVMALEWFDFRGWMQWAGRAAASDDVSKALVALKQRFAVMPGVVLAGDWANRDRKFSLSADDRSALLRELGDLTGQPDAFRALTDADLIGKGAVAAFILAAGIRDRAWFKTEEKIENHRNTMIMENWGHTKKDGLQALTNPQQIALGLEWFDWPAHLLRTFSNSDRQQMIRQICTLVGYRDTWMDIGERLTWLNGIVSPIARSGSDDDMKQLAISLHRSAYPAVERYGHGLDYFGKLPSFAPGLSFGSYDKALDDTIGGKDKFLYAVEESKSAYFATLRAQKDAISDLGQAFKTYGARKDFVQRKANSAADSLKKIEREINANDEAMRLERQALTTKLGKFESKVTAAFGLSVSTLFNCLSQLSFVNASEPVYALKTFSKVGGAASAGAMAVSQIGAMISEAANNVVNDYGDPVRRELLLNQVKVIEDDVDLRSQFKQLSIDYISTDESNRLVVHLEKFKELCEQFRRSLDDGPLLKQLDTYIEAITKRNATIDRYNTLFRQRVELMGECDRLELQGKTVEARLNAKKDPGLAAVAAYVSGLYERAKAQVVMDLYHLYRAYAFWALVPTDGFYGIIGHNPQGISAQQLADARLHIHALLRGSLELDEDAGTTANPPVNFPESDEDLGRIVVLTRKTHAPLFEALESGSADFEILPPTKRSQRPNSPFDPTLTVVVVSDAPPRDAETLPNPFYGMANVRLRKVRAWMVGMRTGDQGHGEHYVELVHTGQERFRTPGDRLYPSPLVGGGAAYVEHGPRPITFAYDATRLWFDPRTKTLTPGSLTGKPGLQDGDLKLRIDRGAELPLQCEFAPIGPFGKWELIVDPDKNPGLSLEHLDMIIIDFHGVHQHFLR